VAQVNPGSLSGTVVDESGNPVGSVRLNFIKADSASGKPQVVKVNKKGKFKSAFFPSGTYRIELDSDTMFLKSMTFERRNPAGQVVERVEMAAHPKEGMREIRIPPSQKVDLAMVVASKEELAELAQQVAMVEVGGDLKKISEMYNGGDMEGVLKETDKVLEKEPDLGAALYLRGAALWKLGRIDEADEVLAHAVEFAPDEEGIWGVRGTVLLERSEQLEAGGDLEGSQAAAREAVTCFEKDLEQNPGSTRALTNRAAAMNRTGDEAALEASLRDLLAVDPSNLAARTRLGTLLTKAERLDDALEVLYGTPEPDHDTAVGIFNVAVILYNDEKLEPALEAANKAVAIDPSIPEIHRLISRIYLGMGNDEAAIPAIQKYLELAGDKPEAQIERNLLEALQKKAGADG
jgi:tetratricopeptide (TPR) repeat protein